MAKGGTVAALNKLLLKFGATETRASGLALAADYPLCRERALSSAACTASACGWTYRLVSAKSQWSAKSASV